MRGEWCFAVVTRCEYWRCKTGDDSGDIILEFEGGCPRIKFCVPVISGVSETDYEILPFDKLRVGSFAGQSLKTPPREHSGEHLLTARSS